MPVKETQPVPKLTPLVPALSIAAVISLQWAQATPARSEPTGPAGDAHTLSDCVAKAGNLEPGCIGLVADACLKTADSQERMGDCETRELKVWDGWLNRDYQVLMSKSLAGAQVRLRTIERAFVADTDQRCGFVTVVNGPTFLNVLPEQECRLRATAIQWLWLKDFIKTN